MEFMFSEKRSKLLVIEYYKFGSHKNLVNNIQTWICTKQHCISYMKFSRHWLCEKVLTHNHEKEGFR